MNEGISLLEEIWRNIHECFMKGDLKGHGDKEEVMVFEIMIGW